MDVPYGARVGNTPRSFNGCWTCRLRRKKCDENYPACKTCAALHITCHYDEEKPEWMDGSHRQEEMSKQIKQEVKDSAFRRRGERPMLVAGETLPTAQVASQHVMILPSKLSQDHTSATHHVRDRWLDNQDEAPLRPAADASPARRQASCALTTSDISIDMSLRRSDSVLIAFYLEILFPFMFPFYHPSPLQGGRAWVLEMMVSRPLVRQIILCQSSYFLAFVQEDVNGNGVNEANHTQTQEAFEVLRQALQIIDDDSIVNHLHGATRILLSILQFQRFEVAIKNFGSCQSHLNAALALFEQLMETVSAAETAEAGSAFRALLNRLGPVMTVQLDQSILIPSAEQAAFRFSTALLVLDDIVASIAVQQPPKLYQYHRTLFDSSNGMLPLVDLEAVMGCPNCVLRQVGEIAVLDAWKQRCKRSGNLNVMELAQRASGIQCSLKASICQMETGPATNLRKTRPMLDILAVERTPASAVTMDRAALATRVWANAALVHLFVVVSGWQPANEEIRDHVAQVLRLLAEQKPSPALLRTMAWPFCVAGCLAEAVERAHIREMVHALQPAGLFGAVYKALEIMEYAWNHRDLGMTTTMDLASCLQSQGHLALLI